MAQKKGEGFPSLAYSASMVAPWSPVARACRDHLYGDFGRLRPNRTHQNAVIGLAIRMEYEKGVGKHVRMMAPWWHHEWRGLELAGMVL